MTGPEHYAEAERLLDEAQSVDVAAGMAISQVERARLKLMAAGIHMGLAQVALAYDSMSKESRTHTAHYLEWKSATG